jgi:hypothetical protein
MSYVLFVFNVFKDRNSCSVMTAVCVYVSIKQIRDLVAYSPLHSLLPIYCQSTSSNYLMHLGHLLFVVDFAIHVRIWGNFLLT